LRTARSEYRSSFFTPQASSMSTNWLRDAESRVSVPFENTRTGTRWNLCWHLMEEPNETRRLRIVVLDGRVLRNTDRFRIEPKGQKQATRRRPRSGLEQSKVGVNGMTQPSASTKRRAATGARPPGRPRSAAAHEAILHSAVALFIEQGFEGMSVEGVAARAGVGKATIYRRWPSKEELVIDAVTQVFAEAATPDTGTVRDDLVQSGRELHVLMSSSLTGEVFPRMAAEVARRSPLGRLYGERVIGPRRAIFGEALLRGIERGELPESTDVELAIDQLVGTLLLRKLTGRLKRSDPTLVERVVDMLLAGLRAEKV
jgi:AcrR family transcriptional regulator